MLVLSGIRKKLERVDVAIERAVARYNESYPVLRYDYQVIKNKIEYDSVPIRKLWGQVRSSRDFCLVFAAFFTFRIRPTLDIVIERIFPSLKWSALLRLQPQVYEIETFARTFREVERTAAIRLDKKLLPELYSEWIWRHEILRKVKAKVEAEEYEVLITTTCAAYQPSYLLAHACSKIGIKCFLMPMDRATITEMEEMRVGVAGHYLKSAYEKKILKKVYPESVRKINGDLLCVTSFTAHIVDVALGLQYSDPWKYNSAPCVTLIARSPEEREWHHRESGIKYENMTAPIGFPKRKHAQLPVPASRTLVSDGKVARRFTLCWSVGNDQFSFRRPFVDHHKDYASMIQAIADDLTSRSYIEKIVASIHPRCGPETREILAKYDKIEIAPDLTMALQLADVCLLASSAVALSALAAGCCVIDYDFYSHNLKCNSGINGIIHVTKYADFKTIFCDGDEIPQAIRTGLKSTRELWNSGYLGQATENFPANFAAVIDGNDKSR